MFFLKTLNSKNLHHTTMARNQEEPSKPNTKHQCEECKENPSKYKCPGCSIRTCSLTCVNSHKKRTSCTGKRSLSDVVPISQFDDNLLLSDYNMLEEVKRMAESAKRARFKLCGNPHIRLPDPLKNLRNAASSRRTRLLFLSSGMSKREKNKSCYNSSKKVISWTIEWRFQSTDVVLVDNGVHENTALSSVIEEHLKPSPWNHTLKQFRDESLDTLKFFIRKYPKGTKSPFRQLNIREPLREQLRDITILEYPVIHVFLPSQSYDFEVMNDKGPSKVQIKEPAPQESLPDHTSVMFKVEEIKDDGASVISDLMNHEHPTNQTGEQPNESLQRVSAILSTEENDIGINSCIEPLTDVADEDFDFDPELMDMYSNLLAEGENEDFLNFDGLLSDEQKDLDGLGFLLDEELEEGEIA